MSVPSSDAVLQLESTPPASISELAVCDDVITAVIADERVEVHAERALHWPRMRTLFVADVHLGKGATFRAGGVPMPRGATGADLDRLSRLVARTGAATLVILGDFLHGKAGRVAALDETFRAWRETQPHVAIKLVRGNHDAHAGDPPVEWGIECVDDPHALPPFIGCHHPVVPRTGYALCGHLHPGVRLNGPGDDSARLPCFVLGRRRTILPAFGRFTGLADVEPLAGDRVVAIAGRRLFALPIVAA